jgi:lactam utilization protein B
MSQLVVNCDLGEGFGSWRLGDDAALMAHIDLANIAEQIAPARASRCVGRLRADGLTINCPSRREA